MASFYGFGIEGLIDDPKYAMQKADIGLDAKTFAEYSGFFFPVTFIPCLLFGSPIISGYKKTDVLGWCTCLWGVAALLHGLCWSMWQLHILSTLIGFLEGISGVLTHILITEYFVEKYKTRAYFAYSMSN